MADRARLVEILREHSVRFGHFVLVSGRESDFYVDGKQTTLHPEGANLIGRLVHASLRPEVEGVGGMSVGADPIAASVAAMSWELGQPVQAFLVRKEPKGHGTQQWLEGRNALPNGPKVCVVEDTTTTGGSLLQAIERVEAEGLEVVQALTVVDRQEGATELLAARGYTLEALVCRADLES